MPIWINEIFTIILAIFASTGFWAFITQRSKTKDYTNELLLGLAHDRITYLGAMYIERTWITKDEYEGLYDYLYVPYEKLGGNGAAKKIIDTIQSKVEIRTPKYELPTTKGDQ